MSVVGRPFEQKFQAGLRPLGHTPPGDLVQATERAIAHNTVYCTDPGQVTNSTASKAGTMRKKLAFPPRE